MILTVLLDWQDSDQIPYWIKYQGVIPKTALKGGFEGGEVLYIGRAMHNGAITPGVNSFWFIDEMLSNL